MNLLKIFPLVVVVFAFCRPALAEYQVGDTVVVIQESKIQVGDKVIQEVPRGVGLKVHAIQGEWLWVSNESTGWIKAANVATPSRAIEAFTEQIKKDPHDADAYVCRGLAWFDKGEVDIAIADLNEAIRMEPTHSAAYSGRSSCWWAKREVDKAIADSSEAIRLDPQEPMYYANRGILWNMKGEYEKAVEDADTALRLSPNLVVAHIVRGTAFTRQHEPAKALAEFNTVLQIDPHEATAFGLRGRVHAETGEYDQAVQDFQKALKLAPNNKDACAEIARFYATCPIDDHRNGEKAVEYGERACELSHWHSASAISILAAAYAETGDFKKAVDLQERATEMVAVNRRSEYRARLNLYKAHKPYRQEPQNVSSSSGRPQKKSGG
jgi:tetratricopeptide (TPR) repeat protein